MPSIILDYYELKSLNFMMLQIWFAPEFSFSVLELVDAAIPSQLMEPYRQAILQVEGVKVCQFESLWRMRSLIWLIWMC